MNYAVLVHRPGLEQLAGLLVEPVRKLLEPRLLPDVIQIDLRGAGIGGNYFDDLVLCVAGQCLTDIQVASMKAMNEFVDPIRDGLQAEITRLGRAETVTVFIDVNIFPIPRVRGQ